MINPDQVNVMIVPKGPSGKALNSSYQNRDNQEYKTELGSAILNVARVSPDGMLVFFPSYQVMDSCLNAWKSATSGTVRSTWDSIKQIKTPFVEPRDSGKLKETMEEYQDHIFNRREGMSGAIFFAVCRGKVSEGLDFADNSGRTVVITGIPFASTMVWFPSTAPCFFFLELIFDLFFDF